MRPIHIDRKAELDLFRDILEGRRAERILLVEAPPGRGKTLLLLEYQEITARAGMPCAALDLRLGSVGVSDVLTTMAEEWGWEQFPAFRRAVEEMLRPTAEVSVSGVVQIGRPQVQVVLGQEDREIRRQRQRLLTDALFQDLRAWLGRTGRAVLFVDTYNPGTVDPELREWLEGVFLGQVRRCEGLIVVIAGQQTPPPNVIWETCCHRLHLRPLDDPDDWIEWVRAANLAVSREVVAAFCHRYRGEPLDIATSLSMLQDWGGAR
jgi:hypothetical protein